MNKAVLSQVVKNAKSFVTKHTPEILTGIGIAGMVTTTVFAVKATPKALELLDDAYHEKGGDLTPVEVVKTAWKPYIPAAMTGVASITCLLCASSIGTRRTAALATAYKLSETALTEYKEKVIETIGEKKEQTIRDKVAKAKIEKNPVSKNEVIITSSGNTLCYDSISGRYFKSDMEKIKAAVNELNRSVLFDMYTSLSDFYDELGLDHTAISDELGWNVDDGKIEIDFSSHIADDGTPCIVINYNVAPKYNFSSLV